MSFKPKFRSQIYTMKDLGGRQNLSRALGLLFFILFFQHKSTQTSKLKRGCHWLMDFKLIKIKFMLCVCVCCKLCLLCHSLFGYARYWKLKETHISRLVVIRHMFTPPPLRLPQKLDHAPALTDPLFSPSQSTVSACTLSTLFFGIPRML